MTEPASPVPEPTILVGEDDPVLLVVIERMLRNAGYGFECGRDGVEVLARFEADPWRFSAAILDVEMPRANGLETIDAMLRHRPSLAIVLTSGFPLEDLTARIGTRPLAGYLRKPWTYEAMIATVDAAVRGPAP